jgi:hypothetical protein
MKLAYNYEDVINVSLFENRKEKRRINEYIKKKVGQKIDLFLTESFFFFNELLKQKKTNNKKRNQAGLKKKKPKLTNRD